MNLRVKLARARIALNLTLDEHLKKKGRSVDGSHHHSTFLSPTGEYVGGGRKHKTHLDQLKGFIKNNGGEGLDFIENANREEELLRKFTEDTGYARVQNTTFLSTVRGKNDPHKISIDANKKLTSPQIKTLKDTETAGHEISATFNRGKYNKGFRDIIKNHAETYNPQNIGKQKIALQPVNKGIQTFHKVKIDPTQGAEIADAYDAAEHRPNDPEVISAYDALNKETVEQYDEMINNGLQITKLKEGQEGYATAQEMHDDILNNNHLSYFPSEQGFGQDKVGDHPMLGASGRFDGERSMPNNDLFRIVHDVNGHVLGDLADFSPEGEHQAFLTHRQQYSEEAGKALYTETAGQANWGAFSREHGESNRRKILDGKHDDLVFAEQKATILPEHIRKGNHHL